MTCNEFCRDDCNCGVGYEDDGEPARPDPGFRVYVERDGDRIDVTHAVMDVFDVAHNSLDFGSGFLSTEQCIHLRQLGLAIGADVSDIETTQGGSDD